MGGRGGDEVVRLVIEEPPPYLRLGVGGLGLMDVDRLCTSIGDEADPIPPTPPVAVPLRRGLGGDGAVV